MGKVVKLSNYIASEQAGMPKSEDHSAFIAEYEILKANVAGMLEGLEEIRNTLTEYNGKDCVP